MTRGKKRQAHEEMAQQEQARQEQGKGKKGVRVACPPKKREEEEVEKTRGKDRR